MCATFVGCAVTRAVSAERYFAIPKQRADLALTAFAQQADLIVLFPFDEVSGRTANRLEGTYEIEEGVAILLDGTGLTAVLEGERQLVVGVTGESDMKRKRARRVFSSLFAAMAASGTATNARAQGDGIEEVTVIGSRIARARDLEAPSPITTITADVFANAGAAGTEVTLNQLPQFLPSQTQFTSATAASPTSTPGAATLNLRGLGTNRNLVLVDGRRPQPSNASLAVDVNTIPSLAIRSVEIITGGASAVYGPDAIAGVINYVLKDDFQGLDVDVQHAETQHDGGAETRINALMGLNGVDGQGNAMVGIEWAKREPVYQMERAFYRHGWLDPSNPSGGQIVAPSYSPAFGGTPSQEAVDALFPQMPPGTFGPATQIFFNADGTPFVQRGGVGYNGPLNSLEPGRYTAMKQLPNGNLDQSFTGGIVSTPLERHSLFSRGTFNFTDDLTAYAELKYSNVEVTTQGNYSPAITLWRANIPRHANDNEWLPPALVDLLNSRAEPDNPWTLYQLTDYMGPVTTKNTTDMWQGTVGMRGLLPVSDWTWDFYVSRGNTHTQGNYSGVASLQRYRYLLSLPHFGKGTENSYPPDTPNGYGITCLSGIPVFEQFELDPTCKQNLTTPLKIETDLRQNIVEATMQGYAFAVPAGDARFALGATYREEKFAFTPNNIASNITDTPIGVFASNNTFGGTDVKEIFGELLLPVAGRLDLELGYRYSDFNTAGGFSTWKSLFTWNPVDSVSLRGGYQAATRAPNVAELFAGPTFNVVTFAQGDPCSVSTLSPWGNVPSNPNRDQVQRLCEAIIGNTTSEFNTQTYNTPPGPDGWTRQSPRFYPSEIEIHTGNPDVKPESGKTWTLGAVISQPFDLDGLTATIDYYSIELSDTIAPQSATTIYNNCFNYNGISNPTYDVAHPDCQLIRRDPFTGDRNWVISYYSNLGLLHTRGVDANVSWSRDVGAGSLNLTTSINYLTKYEYQTAPTAAPVDAKGTLDTVQGAAGQGGLFDYRTFTRAQYSWGNFTVGLNWLHLPSIRDSTASTNPSTPVQDVPSYDLFSLYSSFSFGASTVRFGIQNLTDEQPHVVGFNPGVDSNTNQTNPGFYDPLGRRLYVGFSTQF